MALFDPSTADTSTPFTAGLMGGGGGGVDVGTVLGALGQSLLTSTRQNPFQNFGTALDRANKQADEQNSRAALVAVLIKSGMSPTEAQAYAMNPVAAKLAIEVQGTAKGEAAARRASAIMGGLGSDDASGSGATPKMSPDAPGGPAAGVSLNGSKADKAKAVYDGLVQRGASPVFAAGMTGNIDVESDGFNPGAIGDKGTAFGYHQARGDRFDNLQAIAKAKGVGWQDHDAQLDNIAAEWGGKDAGMAKAKALIDADPNMTPQKAAAIIAQYGERPSAQALMDSMPRRAGTAGQVFGLYGQGAPVQTADNSGAVPKVPVSPVSRAPLAPAQGQSPSRPVQVAENEDDTQRLEGRMTEARRCQPHALSGVSEP